MRETTSNSSSANPILFSPFWAPNHPLFTISCHSLPLLSLKNFRSFRAYSSATTMPLLWNSLAGLLSLSLVVKLSQPPSFVHHQWRSLLAKTKPSHSSFLKCRIRMSCNLCFGVSHRLKLGFRSKRLVFEPPFLWWRRQSVWCRVCCGGWRRERESKLGFQKFLFLFLFLFLGTYFGFCTCIFWRWIVVLGHKNRRC